MNDFTFPEINLINFYDISDKTKLQNELREALPYITEPEISETANSALAKLEQMTEAEFAKLDLVPTLTMEDIEHD